MVHQYWNALIDGSARSEVDRSSEDDELLLEYLPRCYECRDLCAASLSDHEDAVEVGDGLYRVQGGFARIATSSRELAYCMY